MQILRNDACENSEFSFENLKELWKKAVRMITVIKKNDQINTSLCKETESDMIKSIK